MKKNFRKKINIFFLWNELLTYGLAILDYINTQIKKKKFNINLQILRTGTSLPIYRNKNLLFKDIKLIDKNQLYNWNDLKLEYPDLLFVSGWSIKAFNYLRDITKKKNKNIKIVLLSDNSFKNNSLRQFLGIIFFKLFIKKKYDYSWVPGYSAKKLMLKLGFNFDKIFDGLYCAQTNIFKNLIKTKDRKKQFLFVGRLNRIKNVKKLIEAFNLLNLTKKNSRLIIVGNGDKNLKRLNINKSIKFISHLSPLKLRKLYNESQFFILPSIEDHWPLVVHEAALCGCFLLLSNEVKNNFEFAKKRNSFIFNPKSSIDISKTLKKSLLLRSKNLQSANYLSEIIGKKYNYEYSFKIFEKILKSTKLKIK